MAEKVRSVEDIQAAIRDTAERLEETVRGLDLVERLQELEAHHPEYPQHVEPMSSGEVCPSVAWVAHGDLERAAETLTLALAALRKAAGHTAESVRDDWRRRRLATARILLWRAAEDLSAIESPAEDGPAGPAEDGPA